MPSLAFPDPTQLPPVEVLPGYAAVALVAGAGAGAGHGGPALGAQRRRRGAGLRPTGRHPPGDRAGRRPPERPADGAGRGAAGRLLPAADGRVADGGAPPAHAARHDGLEPRAAQPAGAGGAAAAVGLRRRLDPGGGRGHLRRCRAGVDGRAGARERATVPAGTTPPLDSPRTPCSMRWPGSSISPWCCWRPPGRATTRR